MGRGTAEKCASLFLSALLLVPGAPRKAPDWMGKEKALQALLALQTGQPDRERAAVVADWVLYPAGFGFRVPAGMQQMNPPRGTAAFLVDTEQIKMPVRTSITLTITDEDKRLLSTTKKDVEGAANLKGFGRFQLLSFAQERFLGEPALSLLFYTGNAPRLVVSQRMFNRDGKCYIITLSTERNQKNLLAALERFDAFCDSFFFCGF